MLDEYLRVVQQREKDRLQVKQDSIIAQKEELRNIASDVRDQVKKDVEDRELKIQRMRTNIEEVKAQRAMT